MTVKILCVDDEDLSRQHMLRLLNKREESFDLEEACNGLEAIEKITQWSPDIVFLDIKMPGLSGFDVLYQLESRPFQIIFQTAYDEYAVKAFEVNACDYLLKPYNEQRFSTALDKALDGRNNNSLEKLEKKLMTDDIFLSRFVVKMPNRAVIIEEEDIHYFVSKDHTTWIHLKDVSYAYDYSLKFIEDRVDPKIFLRIHRNTMVHRNKIESFSLTTPMTIKLSDGSRHQVAKERRRKVNQILTAT
jgi:two-component system LytT family response regulator